MAFESPSRGFFTKIPSILLHDHSVLGIQGFFSGSVLPSRVLLVDLLLIHSYYGGISASVLASVESEGMDSHSVHRAEGGVHQNPKSMKRCN